MKQRHIIFFFFFMFMTFAARAQQTAAESTDTFFLSKKKGWIGKIGRKISRNVPPLEPVKIVNPFLEFRGKTIRSIRILPLGFNRNIHDTDIVRNNFGIRVANALHKNTRDKIIYNHLFFKEGDRVAPFLLADNERYLRDQDFLQDARIIVSNMEGYENSVEVLVITKDVFSIGGSLSIRSQSRGKTEIREDNLGGYGNKLALFGLLDKERNPQVGAGGELLFRNIKGKFLNWGTGFTTFGTSLTSGEAESNYFYTRLSKDLVSRYSHWMGAAEINFSTSQNGFHTDTTYRKYYEYTSQMIDLWAGYNFGAGSDINTDNANRLRHFVAARSFYNKFYDRPDYYNSFYDARFANVSGLLASYTLYKQNFVRTSFIYGFGRYEDVPEGISASLLSGYVITNKAKRVYYGAEFEATDFTRGAFFTNYIFKLGGFTGNGGMEDVDLLIGANHFTKLRQLGPAWRNRNFASLNFARQINRVLNAPLYLNSQFGLPYFRNDTIGAQTRITVKLESVFFNLYKIAGFRLAPFAFSDFAYLQMSNEPFSKSVLYPAFGAGLRARNENLTLGTVELRGMYIPRPTGGMKNFRFTFSSKLRFRYNSNFIKRPEFVPVN